MLIFKQNACVKIKNPRNKNIFNCQFILQSKSENQYHIENK